MRYRVDPHSPVPPSRQIVEAVLDTLACGELQAGDRLPSVRGMASEALVNPNTVGKSYRDLEHMGVLEGRNGSGVFVTPRGPSLARRARRKATLDALAQAAREALRAGHEVDELHTLLDAVEDAAAQAATAGNGKKRGTR